MRPFFQNEYDSIVDVSSHAKLDLLLDIIFANNTEESSCKREG